MTHRTNAMHELYTLQNRLKEARSSLTKDYAQMTLDTIKSHLGSEWVVGLRDAYTGQSYEETAFLATKELQDGTKVRLVIWPDVANYEDSNWPTLSIATADGFYQKLNLNLQDISIENFSGWKSVDDIEKALNIQLW